MSFSCPICRVEGGEHKMDCQNAYYVSGLMEPLEAEKRQAADHIIQQERDIVGRDRRIAELEADVDRLAETATDQRMKKLELQIDIAALKAENAALRVVQEAAQVVVDAHEPIAHPSSVEGKLKAALAALLDEE